ncbi:MAG: hypothetical protein J6Y89_08705 [Lachnospiraceae bacterium]|nr:hypothetical protein [Lachnospiraceae bacterium]
MIKCPRCGKMREELLSLSRCDNKTMICDQCGTDEAFEDAGMATPLKVWADGRRNTLGDRSTEE